MQSINILVSFLSLLTLTEIATCERLMVVGGFPIPNQVEIVHLGGSGQSCTNMNNVPIEDSAVGTFINGQAIVCNGMIDQAENGNCYIHNEANDSWSLGPSTGMIVDNSASVMINNGNEWWISGGAGGANTEASVLYDGSTFTPYENLPQPEFGHQMVAVNDTHVVVLEGFSQRLSYLYTISSKTWEPFPPLPIDKDYYYAGLATYPDRSRHLVAAGGEINEATWIFELDSGLPDWRPGPRLSLELGASVPFGDTFLAVGGITNIGPDVSTAAIFEFNANPQNETFIQRPEKLKNPKAYAAAFIVPDTYFASC